MNSRSHLTQNCRYIRVEEIVPHKLSFTILIISTTAINDSLTGHAQLDCHGGLVRAESCEPNTSYNTDGIGKEASAFCYRTLRGRGLLND
jgi:hypothetical protein